MIVAAVIPGTINNQQPHGSQTDILPANLIVSMSSVNKGTENSLRVRSGTLGTWFYLMAQYSASRCHVFHLN